MKYLAVIKNFLKLFVLIIPLLSGVNEAIAQPDETDSTKNNISAEKNFQDLTNKFINLTSYRILKIKEGSRPFVISQNKKAPTVVMIHGLSDSPGSMREVSKVYFQLGYNVVTVLLRDHGLIEPYRKEARSLVTLEDWREDIDQVMDVAFQMSDSHQVALIGFSLGGALAVDVADRYEGRISSLVLMAPLFKIYHKYAWAAPSAKYLKHILYSTKKGVPEMPHFYPDIALNQTFQTYELAKYLEEHVTKNPKSNLLEIPKLMLLTGADTTAENNFSLVTAKRLKMSNNNIVLYSTSEKSTVVLHRDLPMRTLNANEKENPHIENLLKRVEIFIRSVE